MLTRVRTWRASRLDDAARICVVSLVVLALGAAWLSYRQFSKEGMVLK